MKLEDLDIGDVVYAAHNIEDDGSMPGKQVGDILAESGARGVIVKLGHTEEEPKQNVYLVRFEDQQMDLGEPIGCFAEDLRVEQSSA